MFGLDLIQKKTIILFFTAAAEKDDTQTSPEGRAVGVQSDAIGSDLNVTQIFLQEDSVTRCNRCGITCYLWVFSMRGEGGWNMTFS